MLSLLFDVIPEKPHTQIPNGFSACITTTQTRLGRVNYDI